jgi:L-alanine-DL-glutamate epimerase-like enolase superfamily enzyme
MTLHITATVDRWPVDGQFIIARGAKDYVDLLVVAVSDGQHIGYGEGTAIYYCGETAEKCLRHVERAIPLLRDTAPRDARDIAQSALSAGAARNALDCALWDLEAKQAGLPLSELLGMKSPPVPLRTAFTISLGVPETMQAHARAAAQNGYSLLKLKINGEADRDRVAAVRSGAPKADIIVDANESWGAIDIVAEAEALKNLGVALIEQPLPAGNDAALGGISAPIPIFADESCHTARDVARLVGLYQGVNIKLDKTGGLTEGVALLAAAKDAGLQSMVGCMLSTSLGIRPAFVLAQSVQWADLDGPALLSGDRPDGFIFSNGLISEAQHGR